MPYVIRKLRLNGHVVKDMYKAGLPDVPTQGGLVLLLIAIFSLSILALFYAKYISAVNYTIVFVVVLFALFGLLDDLINIGRPAKLILLYYCSYPLFPFITTTAILLPVIGSVDAIVYLQVIIPTYVPVVSNLVNMHSGLNGLAPGISLIVLLTLVLKAFFYGNIFNALFIVCLTGAVAGYFWFEKYPSRIFWGNIGALSVGAAIGAMIVTQGFIISGFVMLIPHTINFLLYVYWRLRKFPVAKFGKVREDGTLEVPNPLTLKWVLPYYFKMTEKTAGYAMFAVTGIFCVAGFFIPW
ncbi:MAG TPA: UDP-N-acetylglucosamine-1-phosphate transferase [Methanoregulaceae archaeon]|nr:UDP-N-acetylglucosamine-1-phosphate transferase [Methanoregulaceae archaeon]HPD74529.1 UDP-N-acetylglucosamine-1-phosphate transferase [Methanoregulaceae archaeon]